MPSVQFYGVDQVMQGAENINCSSWAIFAGRAMFMKYEGTDQAEGMSLLQQCLETLQNTNSAGLYHIKFFETVDGKPVKINEKTVCTAGSFNFKLLDGEERESRLIGFSSSRGIIGKMQNEIDELKQKLEHAEVEEVEEETIGSVLIDAIKNPAHLLDLVNVGRAIFGLPVQNFNSATIGGLPDANTNIMGTETNEQRLQRLAAAIDILEKYDAKLIEHLEKLAAMAQKDTNRFKLLISML